jgi:hypothetical protein
MTGSRDTSPSARRAQLTVFQSLEPSTRLELASRMSDEVRAIAEAGIRHRHPTWPRDRIGSAIRDLMIGDDLARRLRSRHSLPRR